MATVNASADIARPAFFTTEAAALVVCSGAAEPEVPLALEGELEGEPEDDEPEPLATFEPGVPLALEDEAVFVSVSMMYDIQDRRQYL